MRLLHEVKPEKIDYFKGLKNIDINLTLNTDVINSLYSEMNRATEITARLGDTFTRYAVSGWGTDGAGTWWTENARLVGWSPVSTSSD